MKLFLREWPAAMPGPADSRGALREASTIVDDEGVVIAGADGGRVTGAADGFCVPRVSGVAGWLDATDSCSCSGMGCSVGGIVVDRLPGTWDAAVACSWSSAVGNKGSSLGGVSSTLDSRLVTLNQLTGRTLVLAWGRGRGIGVVVPSEPSELFCDSGA